MRVCVTGGTGFIGTQLVGHLSATGHEIVVLSRGAAKATDLWDDPAVEMVQGTVDDRSAVDRAADGCDAIAHLAGINFERGQQTYKRVHVIGTEHVVAAAEANDVDALLITSYLRARPDAGAGYFGTKWEAERITRSADVPCTVLKPAAVFGPGDQLLSTLARWFRTVPVLPIPAAGGPLRPVGVADVADICLTALTANRLHGRTIPIMGPEAVDLGTLSERVARALDLRGYTVPVPSAVVTTGALFQERMMDDPVLTRASARMLTEGMTEPAPQSVCEPLPPDLEPAQAPTMEYISNRIESPDRFGLDDLRYP